MNRHPKFPQMEYSCKQNVFSLPSLLRRVLLMRVLLPEALPGIPKKELPLTEFIDYETSMLFPDVNS